MLYQQERQGKEGLWRQQICIKFKVDQVVDQAAQTLKKLVNAQQAHQEDSNNNSSLSSEDGDALFQYVSAAIEATNPKVAMALKSHKARDLDLRCVWILDNQSTFDLCCNPDFARKRRNDK